MYNAELGRDGNEKYGSDDEREPSTRQSHPVTPKMLVKALKSLKKKSFKGLFLSPKEVAVEIMKKYPMVEHNFPVLYLEVSDKLACAAAAGLLGSKQDIGYFAHDLRRNGVKEDSRSELMFWILYKRLLNQRAEEKERNEMRLAKQRTVEQEMRKQIKKYRRIKNSFPFNQNRHRSYTIRRHR